MLYLRRVRGLRLLFLVFSVCAVPAAHGQTCGWGDYYFVLAVEWVHPLTGKPVRGVDAVVVNRDGIPARRGEVKVRRNELPGLGRRRSALIERSWLKPGAEAELYFRIVHRGDTLLHRIPLGEAVHVCNSGFLDSRRTWKPTDHRPQNRLNRPFGVVRIPVPVDGLYPPSQPPVVAPPPPLVVERTPVRLPPVDSSACVHPESGWERFAVFSAQDGRARVRTGFRFRNACSEPLDIASFTVWPGGFAGEVPRSVAPGGWCELEFDEVVAVPPGSLRYIEVTGHFWAGNAEYASPILRTFLVGEGTAVSEGVWRGTTGHDPRPHALQLHGGGARFGPVAADGRLEGRWMQFDPDFRRIADTLFTEPLRPVHRIYVVEWDPRVLAAAGRTPDQARAALSRRFPAVPWTQLSGAWAIDLTAIPEQVADAVVADLAVAPGILRLARVHALPQGPPGWLAGPVDIRCTPGLAPVECMQCLSEVALFGPPANRTQEGETRALIRLELNGKLLDEAMFEALHALLDLPCVSEVLPVNGATLGP